MEIPEVIKKDWKKIEVSKNAVIIILAIGLVLVSLVAVMGSFRGEHMGRYDENDFGPRGMMGQYRQYDGYNVNPNTQVAPTNITPAPATPAPQAQ